MAEAEHADWPSLQRMCATLGLNPKGRSEVVRMRVLDYVRRRTRPEAWRPEPGHIAPLLTRLGFPDLAERLWESTIQLDAPAPWVGLGEANLAAGRLVEATKAFGRASQMGDYSAELHRAEGLAAAGDFEGATRAADRYLVSRHGDLRALAMKAGFLARAGFVDEAASVLRTAAEMNADAPEVGRALAVAQGKAGHHPTAAELFRRAIQGDTRDLDARINLGAMLVQSGRTREGVRVLREALALDSERPETLNNLGVAQAQSGHDRSAAQSLERAAKALELPRILLNLGNTREGAERGAEANRAYAQVLRQRPEDSEAEAGRRRLATKASVQKRASKSSKKTNPPTKRPRKRPEK